MTSFVAACYLVVNSELCYHVGGMLYSAWDYA